MITAVAAAVLATAVTSPASAAQKPQPAKQKPASLQKKVAVRGSGGGAWLLNWSVYASLRP